ncbi:MAG TPA: ribonuclease P protein component [Minicystis sp.]|nr:ribonuclease P protein component [Minicystis sp.]
MSSSRAGAAASPARRPFPRSAHLRARADFLRVQKGAYRAEGRAFLVLADASPAGTSRLGVVASRRVGCAVERNRAKRLVREVYRRHRPELPPALDLVVVARAAAPSLGYADAEAELMRAFGRIARLAQVAHGPTGTQADAAGGAASKAATRRGPSCSHGS